jgi:hypothetical protein
MRKIAIFDYGGIRLAEDSVLAGKKATKCNTPIFDWFKILQQIFNSYGIDIGNDK